MGKPTYTDDQALDIIAGLAATDDDGCWTDPAGLLEGICTIIEATNRTVPHGGVA